MYIPMYHNVACICSLPKLFEQYGALAFKPLHANVFTLAVAMCHMFFFDFLEGHVLNLIRKG